jgi:sugar lactone lactonase YvrE
MVKEFKATLAIDSGDIIGEAPMWDAVRERILWSDNKPGVIYEARADEDGRWHKLNEWKLGRRIGAGIRRSRGGFIVVSGTEFLLLDHEGKTMTVARLDADPSHFHLNDAKCDAQGRLWTGTLDSDVNIPGRAVTAGRGALYKLDPDGTLTTMIPGVTVSNGIDWSPDGAIFYFIDSYTRQVDAFDFDAGSGTITNRRPLVVFAQGDGAPDGMTVDREGGLWVALPGTGQVRRYAPDGQLLARVLVDTPTPTSCAFGGTAGDILFITSARVKLPAIAFTRLTHGFTVEVDGTPESGAGGLYICRPGVTGRPANEFAG